MHQKLDGAPKAKKYSPPIQTFCVLLRNHKDVLYDITDLI